MQRSPAGFIKPLLFALLVIGVPGMAAAQDMPPILAPLAPSPAAPPNPPQTSPSAEAIIPPAVVVPHPVPAKKTPVATAVRPRAAHHVVKSAAAERKRLAAAHAHAATRVALRQTEPGFPPGTVVPPPDYYGADPRERLVYGGTNGLYGWGGYRGRYPYYYR